MLLLALIAQASAVDAERAFARSAQTGQWKAFRATAAPNAVMFVPQPTNAQRWLATAREPARALTWEPSESYVSCDGRMAVNTGTWNAPNGGRGYFTTVWVRQPNGAWRWVYDGGDALATQPPAPKQPKVRRAACRPRADDALGARETGDLQQGEGRATDNSLQWRWTYTRAGARALDVYLWNGTEMERVIEDRIDPPVARR